MLEPFREGVSVPLDDKEYELESGFVDRSMTMPILVRLTPV